MMKLDLINYYYFIFIQLFNFFDLMTSIFQIFHYQLNIYEIIK